MSPPPDEPRREEATPAPAISPDPAPSTATGPSLFGPGGAPSLSLSPSLLGPARGPLGSPLSPYVPSVGTGLPPPSLLGGPRVGPGLDQDVYDGLRMRGLSVSDAWVGGAEEHYARWYPLLAHQLGLGSWLSNKLLNLGVSSMVEREAARMAPTPMDTALHEIDVAHQMEGAVQTPIFTIFSTDWFRGGDE